ncbi:hypothetical protein FACS1894167_10000 [Synergistales bacterium]|nr:hypothetical protein FACS1894167_10000 [Synergistales bacterium]
MSRLELWSVFFSVGSKPEYRKLLLDMTKAREEIKLASELLANISSDLEQRARYLSRKKFRMDHDHDMIVSFREGEAKGIEKGKFEIARSMLADRIPIDAIIKYTGLSEQEIFGKGFFEQGFTPPE